MKGTLKKGIATFALAGMIASLPLSLAACTTAQQESMSDIGEGYVILNDENPNIYRLHKLGKTTDEYTLVDCNLRIDLKNLYYGRYDSSRFIVVEKYNDEGELVSRQYDPYIKYIAEGQEIDPKCYDEVCEECFPDLNK